jgi:hypothetical protein
MTFQCPPFPSWRLDGIKLGFRTRFCAAVLALLALGAPAARAVSLSMVFTGVVSPGSSGGVFPYGSGPLTTSFDGQPFQISLTVTGQSGSLYVSGFSESWSQLSYTEPFITGWSGTGLPQSPENDLAIAFYSNVSLNADGGSIQIFPTNEWFAATDGDFGLSLSYSLSQPENPYGSFSDPGLTGSGSFLIDLVGFNDPILGPYDAGSGGQFSLTKLTQTTIPEPATWAMFVLGLGVVGFAARYQRRAVLSL